MSQTCGDPDFDLSHIQNVGTTDMSPHKSVLSKQHRQNELSWSGRHSCQKQHRQNDLAGQVDILARMEVRVMSHNMSKTTQTA